MSAESRPGVITCLLVGSAISLPFVVMDILVAGRILNLGLQALFTVRRGSAAISVAAYDLVLVTLLGSVLGVAAWVAVSNFNPSGHLRFFRLHMVISVVGVSVSIIAVRIWSHLVLTSTIELRSLALVSLVFAAMGTSGVLLVRRGALDFLSKGTTPTILTLGWIITVLIVLLWPNVGRQGRLDPGDGTPQSQDAPNVLLIVLDTLRADALSAYGGDAKNTPNLDSLASQGALFTRALSSSSWTLPAHASLFTGLYPSQHGTGWEHRRLESDFVTIAESFEKHGYQTVGFSENPFLEESTGFSQGFTEFLSMGRIGKVQEPVGLAILTGIEKLFGRHLWTGEYTVETITRFESWIQDRKDSNKPYFAFLNFMAPHLPSYPRRGESEISLSGELRARIAPIHQNPERFYLEGYRLDNRELTVMRELYLSDVRFLDDQLGSLFSGLSSNAVLDDTIVVVTSDHGENFGDHDMIEHQFCLFNSLLHVPLIIRYPRKVMPGQVYDQTVSTVFLPATLEYLTDLELLEERPDVERRVLFDTAESQWLYFEYENPDWLLRKAYAEAPEFDYSVFSNSIQGITDGAWKLIRYSNGKKQLFQISTDWKEEFDLSGRNPLQLNDLEANLDEWLNSLAIFQPTTVPPEIDPQTQDALRALGYVD